MSSYTREVITVYKFTVSVSEFLSRPFGYFVSAELGKKLSKGKGWYGSDGSNSGAVNVIVFTDTATGEMEAFTSEGQITVVYDENQYQTAQELTKIKSAMSKLSENELKLLLDNQTTVKSLTPGK